MNLSDYKYTIEKTYPELNYKYDENGYILLTGYSGISTFWGKWESLEEGDTEIVIGRNDIFTMDHYTKASEITGNYKITDDKITFTSNDETKKWNGQLLMKNKDGELLLKVNIDGKNVVFKITEHIN
ncbi:MAG: hypothetical protein K6B70_02175 [Clostridia bacterium]|nr:hypothetical protein [Clostridia bacterium]